MQRGMLHSFPRCNNIYHNDLRWIEQPRFPVQHQSTAYNGGGVAAVILSAGICRKKPWLGAIKPFSRYGMRHWPPCAWPHSTRSKGYSAYSPMYSGRCASRMLNRSSDRSRKLSRVFRYSVRSPYDRLMRVPFAAGSSTPQIMYCSPAMEISSRSLCRTQIPYDSIRLKIASASSLQYS